MNYSSTILENNLYRKYIYRKNNVSMSLYPNVGNNKYCLDKLKEVSFVHV